jgi:glycosyltransferase involved in cell wall biosynthesis
MRKKKIVWHTNSYKFKSGFGRNSKAILGYLARTGKYDIVEYCTATKFDDPSLKNRPWKAYGSLPPDSELVKIQNDSAMLRSVSYGSKYIDEIIQKEKPDVYIGVEDIWAFQGYWDKKWWNKITPVIHTTLDSLPILDMAKQAAEKTENYYVWAKFAEKEMNKLGFDNVKTMHGAFGSENFHPIPIEKKEKIRRENGIVPGAFIAGFVFRNQLRKSVPQLLEGFAKFLKDAPNAYLYLHTCWSENKQASWDIPALMKSFDIPQERILTTYVCEKCGKYYIRPYSGEGINCQVCGGEKTIKTTGTTLGVSELQLNEIYNTFDVLVHPFTSGGQEIPIQEAKLTGLITLVTNYSCGEEYCLKSNGGLPLDWSPYFEPGSNFMKATTIPADITKKLLQVYKMSEKEKYSMSSKAIAFAQKEFDTNFLGEKWENIIDNAPFVVDESRKDDFMGENFKIWDFDFSEPPKNPDYVPSDEKDNVKWLQEIYENILNLKLPEEDKGMQDWLKSIDNGVSRDRILETFRSIALKDNQEIEAKGFEELLDKGDEGKRIAIVMPESAGDVLMVTSLLPNIKSIYPDHNLYFITKPQFFDIIDGHPDIHKVIPFSGPCENLLMMEGTGEHKGFFEVCYLPHIGTQRQLDYLHNGVDKIQLNINETEKRSKNIAEENYLKFQDLTEKEI